MLDEKKLNMAAERIAAMDMQEGGAMACDWPVSVFLNTLRCAIASGLGDDDSSTYDAIVMIDQGVQKYKADMDKWVEQNGLQGQSVIMEHPFAKRPAE